MKIDRLSKTPQTLNWLLYGLPGSTKTAMAATACLHEEMRDVLILAIEGGMLTVRNMDLGGHDPLMSTIEGTKEVEEVFWALANKSEDLASVRTVVIDSVTELGARDVENTTGRNLGKKSRDGKRRANIDDIWLEDRGEVSGRQARIARWFRDLPLHTIMTAHPRIVWTRDKDNMPREDLPPKLVEPGFGPRLRQHICGYMDFVWYLRADAAKNCAYVCTETTGPYYAKTRGSLARVLGSAFMWREDDPVLPMVYDTVMHNKPFPLRINKKEQQKESQHE